MRLQDAFLRQQGIGDESVLDLTMFDRTAVEVQLESSKVDALLGEIEEAYCVRDRLMEFNSGLLGSLESGPMTQTSVIWVLNTANYYTSPLGYSFESIDFKALCCPDSYRDAIEVVSQETFDLIGKVVETITKMINAVKRKLSKLWPKLFKTSASFGKFSDELTKLAKNVSGKNSGVQLRNAEALRVGKVVDPGRAVSGLTDLSDTIRHFSENYKKKYKEIIDTYTSLEGVLSDGPQALEDYRLTLDLELDRFVTMTYGPGLMRDDIIDEETVSFTSETYPGNVAAKVFLSGKGTRKARGCMAGLESVGSDSIEDPEAFWPVLKKGQVMEVAVAYKTLSEAFKKLERDLEKSLNSYFSVLDKTMQKLKKGSSDIESGEDESMAMIRSASAIFTLIHSPIKDMMTHSLKLVLPFQEYARKTK